MTKLIRLPLLAAFALTSASPIFAQEAKTQKKGQEIVIRQNGDKGEKMTIVVDGNNVTINGKPVDEYKNGDVTVFRRNTPVGGAGATGYSGNPNFRHFRGFATVPNKAMLGVMTQKTDEGVKITEVTKESGAEKAGLQKDDIITKVGDTKIETPQDLVEAIKNYKPNDKVDLTYKRNGKESKTTATLVENKNRTFSFNNGDFNFEMPNLPLMPSAPGAPNFNFNFSPKPKIGLQIQDVEEGKGVAVKDVDENSPAAIAGIKESDVITEINGKAIAGVDDLRNEMRNIKEGETAKFTFKRNGKSETVEVKIPKRLKTADL